MDIFTVSLSGLNACIKKKIQEMFLTSKGAIQFLNYKDALFQIPAI